jgi:hypothetical protein
MSLELFAVPAVDVDTTNADFIVHWFLADSKEKPFILQEWQILHAYRSIYGNSSLINLMLWGALVCTTVSKKN